MIDVERKGVNRLVEGAETEMEAEAGEQAYSFTYALTFDPWRISADEALETMVPLPSSDARQQVHRVEVVPKPQAFHTDELGNHIAVLTLKPGEKLTVHADVTLRPYTFGKSVIQAAPASARDLSAEVMVPLTDDIRALATSLTKAVHKDEAKAFELFKYVRDELFYEYPPQARGAQETLERGKGDCGEFSALYIALCRAADIPARMVMGWLVAPWYVGAHAWAETYLEAHGWIPVDASMANNPRQFADILRTPATKDFYFGNLSRYHLTLSRGTGLAWLGEMPAVVPEVAAKDTFIVDGKPFGFWQELYDGKVPYLQLPYVLISKPKGNFEEDGAKVTVEPKLKTPLERLNFIADYLAFQPLLELVAIMVAIVVRILFPTSAGWLTALLFVAAFLYLAWCAVKVYADVRSLASSSESGRVRWQGLSGKLVNWLFLGFFGYRMLSVMW